MDDAGGLNGTWRSWKRTRPWPVEAGSTPAVPTRRSRRLSRFPSRRGNATQPVADNGEQVPSITTQSVFRRFLKSHNEADDRPRPSSSTVRAKVF